MFRALPVYLAAALLLSCGSSGSGDGQSAAKRWPGARWEVSSPEAEGMDAAKLEAARRYAFAPARNTQGVVVVRNGAIVAEWYAGGADARTLGTSWSMAKSFASTLVGIAIDHGEIDGLDVPLAELLPEWRGTDKQAVTLRDLLEMRSGILWDENIGAPLLYTDGVDQLAFALARPQSRVPGTFWNYSSGDSMVISGVIGAATGRGAHEYAGEMLFRPIGMSAEWWVDAAGHALTYCCIDAPTREFARFGLLFARGGEWDGKQVVSRAWVEEATRPLDGAPFYALQWWTNAGGVMAASAPHDLFAARGLFNQDVYVVPSLDLVVVRNGSYRRVGNGETVRKGANAHVTPPPDEWDEDAFLGPIVASIEGAAEAVARAPAVASEAERAAARAATEAAGIR